MNIIPLVFSFLLILGMSSSFLLKHTQATELEVRSYLGRVHTFRLARNQFENGLFDQLKNMHTKKGESPSNTVQEKKPVLDPTQVKKRTDDEEAEYLEKKKRFRSCNYSTLNVAYLLNHPSSIYHTIAENLITALYGHTPFFKDRPQLAHQVLEHIVDFAKEHPSFDSLHELLEKDDPLQQILYKMFKGTSAYSLEKQQGYPPFTDFFSLKKDDPNALRLHFASLPLMHILFGEEITKKISAIEKKKWEEYKHNPYVTREELENLVNAETSPQHPFSILSEGIFFKADGASTIKSAVEDTKTKIRLRRS